MFTSAHLWTWAICGVATGGVIVRPFKLPEVIWAIVGAVALMAFGLLPLTAAIGAVAKGNDVYSFLIGMMVLSETARHEGLFDWLAAFAVNAAEGSSTRLFALVYAVGTLVTIFLSNDATAVVLTPAVFAATRKARVAPMPFLFVCALVANAASFVLPISNPANLVLYGDALPTLVSWLTRFILPSALAVTATYAALRWVERDGLKQPCARDLDQPVLSKGGWVALGGICVTVAVLMTVSAFGMALGLPTAALGAVTLLAVTLIGRTSPLPLFKEISWSVIALVAGLFVMVEALSGTGVIAPLGELLSRSDSSSVAASAGTAIAVGSNLMNNLPAGLIARSAVDAAHVPQRVIDTLLIGLDLGPNLSVTGSLATILWLTAIRRERQTVSFGRFLKVGAIVMPPALLLAMGARILVH